MLRKILRSSVLPGLVGGGIVAAVLLLTGAVGGRRTERTTFVQESPIARDAASSTTSRGFTAHDIYEIDGPGVVKVDATIVRHVAPRMDLFPQEQGGESSGSGFVIDERGHILTNWHVVAGASGVKVIFGQDKVIDAKVVGEDPQHDLALLQVDPGNVALHPLELGTSKGVEVGDPVVALGNPYSLDRTLTYGVISGIQSQITSPNGFTIDHVLLTDAQINPGDSGGPLIDAAGRVIGINSQIETAAADGSSVGIGAAIPIDTAKQVLPLLEKNGRVERSYLGIDGLSIDRSLSAVVNLGARHGVLVEDVLPHSPAARAGLKGGDTQATIDSESLVLGGDVITALDGAPVRSMDGLLHALDAHKPGDSVTLGIVRGGRSRALKVILGTEPAKAVPAH